MKKILIIGSAGHARVVADAVSLISGHKVVGFLDDYKTKKSKVLGLPVLGSISDLSEILGKSKDLEVFVAVGDNWQRYAIVEKITKSTKDIVFATIIHPAAVVSKSAKVGKGTVVLASAVISSGAVIGTHCIINTAAVLEHDSTMHDFSSLAPGVATGGEVAIGRCTAVGLGAVVVQRVSLGDHSVIGAGSVVTKSILEMSVAYGVPAKIVRARAKEEKYL